MSTGSEGSEDPIDLSMLPPAHLESAREVIRRIGEGESHTCFKGKRLKHDRRRISVPLGRHWRLLFVEVESRDGHTETVRRFEGQVRRPLD